jgi:hypothetical protein
MKRVHVDIYANENKYHECTQIPMDVLCNPRGYADLEGKSCSISGQLVRGTTKEGVEGAGQGKSSRIFRTTCEFELSC